MLATFKSSLSDNEPSADLSVPLKALWFAARGEWERAHTLVMNVESREAAWVHAYLHRVEGDLPNARYWYVQAGREPASGALESEWSEISQFLLVQKPGPQR